MSDGGLLSIAAVSCRWMVVVLLLSLPVCVSESVCVFHCSDGVESAVLKKPTVRMNGCSAVHGVAVHCGVGVRTDRCVV